MIGLRLYRSLTVLDDKDPVINQVALIECHQLSAINKVFSIKCPQVDCSSLAYQPNAVRYL